MMAAHPQGGTAPAARHAQPLFADCKACGKLTLQTGKRACQDRHQCGGMVVNLFEFAETEYGAVAVKLAKQRGGAQAARLNVTSPVSATATRVQPASL